MSAQKQAEALLVTLRDPCKGSTTQAEALTRLMTCLKAEQASISHVMLRWHEHVTSCFGAGCILRTLTCVHA
ncbi:hypothetical protein WJX77_009136 [Trebouxia sp. C0004]